MLRVSGAKEITMLGYCLGATLATVYAAHYPDAPIRNLILLTAPIDFSSPPEGSMAMWLEEERLDVDNLVGAFDNVPGRADPALGQDAQAGGEFRRRLCQRVEVLDDRTAVEGWQAINRWVEDVIPFAGAAFRQFVQEYVRGNELIKGQHEIEGQHVDLAKIDASLLNIVAKYDHLVAQSQSESLMELVSSEDKELRVIPSTHVGIMASGRARYKLWPELVEWLAPRSG